MLSLTPRVFTSVARVSYAVRFASRRMASNAGEPVTYHIDVVSDNVCPWCFVGKRHMEAAIKSVPNAKFNVDWKPFFLDPGMKGTKPLKEHLREKYGSRIPDPDSPSNPLNVAGKKCGINFNPDRLSLNTLDSHRLVELAKKHGKQDEAIEAIFHSYFENAENIADRAVLERIGAELGLPNVKEYLESDEDKDHVFEEYAQYTRKISGVPFFVISKEGGRRRLALSGAQPTEAFLEAFEELQG